MRSFHCTFCMIRRHNKMYLAVNVKRIALSQCLSRGILININIINSQLRDVVIKYDYLEIFFGEGSFVRQASNEKLFHIL